MPSQPVRPGQLLPVAFFRDSKARVWGGSGQVVLMLVLLLDTLLVLHPDGSAPHICVLLVTTRLCNDAIPVQAGGMLDVRKLYLHTGVGHEGQRSGYRS
jgi:hypothetical protein